MKTLNLKMVFLTFTSLFITLVNYAQFTPPLATA